MTESSSPPKAAPPPPELAHLRDSLKATDEALVAILAERMRIVREVARTKARRGLPSFDREREGAHLDDLLLYAGTHDLPAEVVRDVFGTLFAASRGAQRHYLQAEAPRFSIGIVGGTRGMGAFMARVFGSAGFPVETMGLEGGASPEDVAARHDLVVLAVPIAQTVAMAERVAPHVRPGTVLMDVTSLKRAPMEAMLRAAPEGVEVVGTHPMFGPAGEDFDRQKVVLVRGRGDAGFLRVKQLYELFGAEIIESTAEEHDAQMALIQVLVHEKTMVLGSVLERRHAGLVRSLQFASPIYRMELAMVGRMFSQSAELYADILTNNPESPQISTLFEQEASFFARAVAMRDRDTVVKRFAEIAVFMKEFAAWAKKESDTLLHDATRRG
jgi:chorismate mutase/prephenate dehydrogenase